MKKLVLVLGFMFLVVASVPSFAAPQNINANISNSESHANSNSSSHSNSSSSVRNNVSNKQAQGQLQAQGQQNSQISSPSNTTSDNSGSGNKAYAVAYPSITGEVGNSTGNAGSIFGNFSISNTEKYKQVEQIIQVINAEITAGAIDKSVGQYMIDALNSKLLGTVKTQRVLGILWETSGKNLSNLMGLLTWDSFWKDGTKQGGDMSTVLDTTETNSTVTGDSTK